MLNRVNLNLFIQDMVKKALALKPGEIGALAKAIGRMQTSLKLAMDRLLKRR